MLRFGLGLDQTPVGCLSISKHYCVIVCACCSAAIQSQRNYISALNFNMSQGWFPTNYFQTSIKTQLSVLIKITFKTTAQSQWGDSWWAPMEKPKSHSPSCNSNQVVMYWGSLWCQSPTSAPHNNLWCLSLPLYLLRLSSGASCKTHSYRAAQTTCAVSSPTWWTPE